MSTELRIPSLGFSTQRATLAEWLQVDGATVNIGQPLYIIETEKSAQEVESPVSGTLSIVAAAGKSYDVGTLIAKIV